MLSTGVGCSFSKNSSLQILEPLHARHLLQSSCTHTVSVSTIFESHPEYLNLLERRCDCVRAVGKI
jgi:hypothetical protein